MTTWPDSYLIPGVAPYFQEEAGIIYCGDCRDILPKFKDKSFDLCFADPPYGVNKADWDKEFNLDWLDEVGRLSWKIALTPGTWNILSCPSKIADLQYRWTMAAHLVNGMTRGRMGFSNWIPCLIYCVDYSHNEILSWCRRFGDWCRENKIRNSDLDGVCGTSAMGDWWTGRSLKRVQLPKKCHWEKINDAFNPPEDFSIMPNAVATAHFEPIGDCQDFTIGVDDKPDHPSPKPYEVMKWLLKALKGDTILDPFLGSGTTAVVAKELGRRYIGVEIKEKYCEIAVKRLKQCNPLPFTEPKKPKKQQGSLSDAWGGL
jgi:site-specific DNA-methyltransferase (adenine-specific)